MTGILCAGLRCAEWPALAQADMWLQSSGLREFFEWAVTTGAPYTIAVLYLPVVAALWFLLGSES